MTIVTRPAPAAYCPRCELPGEGHDHQQGQIHSSNYLCPAGHIWLTKWADDLEDTA